VEIVGHDVISLKVCKPNLAKGPGDTSMGQNGVLAHVGG
jgi:hypothetical protein